MRILKGFFLFFLILLALAGIVESKGGRSRSGSSSSRHKSSSSSGGGFWSKIFGGGSSKSHSSSSSQSNSGHSVPSAPPEPSVNKIQTKDSSVSSEPVGWKNPYFDQNPQSIGFKPELFSGLGNGNQHLGGSHHVPQLNSQNNPKNQPIGWSNNFPSAPTNPSQMSQPFIPSQTILIPSQGTSFQQPGIGQIAKEAAVHATVNQAVNRIINGSPYHHHHYYNNEPLFSSSSSSSSSSLPSSDTRPSTSDVTVNNYYGEPPSVVPLNPSESLNISSTETPISSTETPISSTVSHYSPNLDLDDIFSLVQKYPSMSAWEIAKKINELEKEKVVDDSISTTENLMELNSKDEVVFGKLMRSKDDDGSQTNLTVLAESRYNISKEKIENLTETLFNMEEYRLDNFILYNLEDNKNSTNITDQEMLYVSKEISNIPTVKSLINLYDNYEMNSTIKESKIDTMRSEEYALVDQFMNTRVMKTAMNWLVDNRYIVDDESEKIDALHHIWFTKRRGSTCGFENIFMAEIYPEDILNGTQNWIYFDHLETLGEIKYKGYTDKLIIKDTKTKVVKVNLEMKGIVANRTMLIGTSPELEIALYTVCFFTRPNDYCPISLGETKFNIYTHSYHVFGKNPIDYGYLSF